MSTNEIISGLAITLGTSTYGFYLWQVFHRTVKPHVFSWIVWGTTGLIGFAAQYAAKAGPGAWVIGIASALCLVVAGVGFFYGEKSITRSDWVCFISSLSAIPAWLATSNPLWAVVIVSIIDALAFYPTFRKSWVKPHEEGVVAFFAYGIQILLSIVALDNYTLTTVLYPAVIVALNMSLVLMLLYRRRMLA